MNTTDLYEYDRKKLEKFKRFVVLPNYFKKIGLGLFIASMLLLLGVGIFTEGNETLKLIVKNVILISLLLMVLAREVVEDELVEKLRGQAFSFAFVIGVIYAIAQPYVNYLVAALIRPEKAEFEYMGEFVVLWFMLVIYLCFFRLFKQTT